MTPSNSRTLLIKSMRRSLSILTILNLASLDHKIALLLNFTMYCSLLGGITVSSYHLLFLVQISSYHLVWDEWKCLQSTIIFSPIPKWIVIQTWSLCSCFASPCWAKCKAVNCLICYTCKLNLDAHCPMV